MPKSFAPAGSARNIRKVLDKARPSQIQAGVSWYRRYATAALGAAAQAGYLAGPFKAGQCGVKARRIIGIAAAFSINRTPNCNLGTVFRFVREQVTGQAGRGKGGYWHSPSCDAKALAMWQGTDPADVLNGPKERAFYFASIGDSEHVTIDGHAYAIWLGQRITTNRIKVPRGGLQRAACVADYRAVAEAYGVSPADVQAITWVAWRDRHQDAATLASRSFGGHWMDD